MTNRGKAFDLIHMLAAMLMGVGAMFTIFVAGRANINGAFTIARNDRQNTVITQNDSLSDTDYVPVNKNGDYYYEGEITGVNVLEEIKEADKDIIIVLNGENLSAQSYSGQKFLDYVRNYSNYPLQEKILKDYTYLRSYVYNPDGSIAKITYTLK